MIKYGISWAVWQLERGASAAGTHIQYTVEFRSPVRMSFLTKAWPGIHADARRGTPEEAKTYCTKERTRIAGPWEKGVFPTGQGHRTDLDILGKTIQDGASFHRLAVSSPSMVIRYSRGIQALKTWHFEPLFRPFLDVIVHWGATGTGKTWTVYMENDDVFAVMTPSSNGHIWFDGYDQQKIVLFDDFRPDWMTSSLLLRLLDKYPMTVEVKGAQVAWNPKKIFITTDAHPSGWFEDSSTTRQLLRRISEIIHFS